MAGYVISNARKVASGRVVIEVVTDGLQRLAVMMPYNLTTAEQIDETITHAIAGLVRPAKPIGIGGK